MPKSRTLATLLLAAAFSLSLWAQQQTQPAGPTFSSSTELVLVPVHAQRHGEHVAGLKQDSFTLMQDGKPQKIALFDEIRTTTKRLQRVQLPAGEFTNQLEGDANAARYTVIAIDRINTSTMDMHRLRDGLLKFLKQTTDSGEPIRLVAVNLSSIRVIQDFTTDPKLLAAALERMNTPAGQVESGPGDAAKDDSLVIFTMLANGLESQGTDSSGIRMAVTGMQKGADQISDFTDRTSRINSLEALQQVAISLSGFPGRKSVVWASSGYPFSGVGIETARLCSRNCGSGTAASPDAPDSWRGGYNFSHAGEAMGMDEYTTHLLSSSNIAVYPVDVRGIVNTGFDSMDPSRVAPGQRAVIQARNEDVTTTFVHLADATGGKACYGRQDVSGCFKEALDDERDYYVVGYYVDRKATQPGWHRINVKVSESGVNVRARTGFLLESFSPDKTKTLDVKLEMASGLQGVGLPFRGRWLPPAVKGDKKSVGLELHVSPDARLVAADQAHLNLEVAALARRPDGTVAGQMGEHVERDLPAGAVAQILKDGITYRNGLDLPPGRYMVRIVIRDNNTGRMGSLSTPLTLE